MNKRKYDITYLTTKYGSDIINNVKQILDIYYMVFDVEKGTNHFKIFQDVFLNCDKKYEDIANIYCISESTLRRYLNQYFWLAEELLRLDFNLNHNFKLF